MNRGTNKRSAFFAGASISVMTLSMLAATPAEAACTWTSTTTRICTGSFWTNNTSGSGGYDRHLTVTLPGTTYTTVLPGTFVSGYGLAVTSSQSGAGAQIINDGVVSVSSNNTATAGGWNNAAVALNGTPGGVQYSGTGNIYNFGYGDGLGLYTTNFGAIARIEGNIAAYHGNAVSLYDSGVQSASFVYTGAGTTLRSSGGAGILMQASGAALELKLYNHAAILSAAAPNSFYSGIFVESYGDTANLDIEDWGDIGTATDRAINYGIIAGINNASSTGTLLIGNAKDHDQEGGDIYSGLDGIYAATNGQGSVDIQWQGNIDSSSGAGVHVRSNNIALNSMNILMGGAAQTIRAASAGILAEIAGTTGSLGLSIGNNATILSSGGPNRLGVGISATSSGSGIIQINHAGAIGSASDRASNGIVVQNTSTGSTGNILVAGTGSIYSIDDGIRSSSNTGGSTRIYSYGTINTSGGDGIDVLTSSGAQDIVVGGNVAASGAGKKGVNANSGTGAIYVRVMNGGNVASGAGAGVGVSSASGMTVQVQSGSSVTATTAVLAGGSGSLGVLNYGTTGTAGGKAIVTSRENASASVYNYNGVLNGSVELTVHDDYVHNSATWNASGLNNFDLGNDRIVNQASGVMNLASGTSINGLESFTNAGTVTTDGSLTFDTRTTVDNQGNWVLRDGAAVSGLGVLTNSGGVNVAGQASMGLTQLTNSGTINLANSDTKGMLTLTGNYVGSGSAGLLIDSGSGAADKLVITGQASGTTSVFVNLLAPIATDLLVVDTGTSTNNAFVLGGDLSGNPLFNVALTQKNDDYYLSSTPSALAMKPLTLGSRAQDMWVSSAGASLDNAMQHRAEVKAMRGKGLGFWNYDGQSGIDFMAPKGNLVAGLTSTVIGNRGSQNGEALEAKGNSVGAYLLLGDPAGLHGSLIAKRDWSEGDLGHSVFAGMRPDTTSTGIEGELAKGFKLGSVNLDAEAGLAYVHTDVDGFSKTVGRMTVAYDFDSVESLRGNLGLKASFGGPLAPFVSARLSQEFMGDRKMTLTSGDYAETVKRDGSDTSLRLEAGLGSPGNSGAMLTGWVEGGRDKTAGVRGRFRF